MNNFENTMIEPQKHRQKLKNNFEEFFYQALIDIRQF